MQISCRRNLMNKQELKDSVKHYWDKASCGTEFIAKPKFSPEYFQEIENFRYTIEPEIFSFAQFTRFYGKKILEVGVGAGSDFLQWVRAGTQAHGIDLTPEAIEHVKQRLNLYALNAHDLQVADAEHLPYQDNTFDLVYSWGVIHHSPDTEQCLREIVRVTKPNGTIKIMIYNRRSLFAFYRYVACGLLKGKPFRSFKSILYDHQESPGTKAYTFQEAHQMIAQHNVTLISLKATVSAHDLLYYKGKTARFFAYLLACFLGWNNVGWFMTLELRKNSE